MKSHPPRRAASFLFALALSCTATGLAWSAPALFVNLSTGQVASGATPTAAATTTIAPPGAGWAYSAAAPVAGTTWNNILRPNPSIGSNSTSTVGEYICNSAGGIALASSTGEATGVTLSVLIDIRDLEGNTTRTEPNSAAAGNTVLGPAGLMGQCWRIYRGGNGTIHRFAGLAPGRHYFLYVYGTTTTAGQGARFTLDADNTPAGGATFVDVRGGNSGNIFTTDGYTYALTAPAPVNVASTSSDTHTWGRLHAVADAGGALEFRTAKNAANGQYLNGYQLVPYPTPVITLEPPASATATVGGDVTLTVSAIGEGAITYQWRKDGSPIVNGASGLGSSYSGVDGASLTISGVSAADEGDYDVLVSNPGGSTTSVATALGVTTDAIAPAIVAGPLPANAVTGAPVGFSVSANGTAPLAYRWQKSVDNVSFTDVAGADASALDFASVTVSDAGYYRVVVTNSAGSATSAVATLTVAPVITAAPAAAIVGSGASHTLTVVADAGAGAPAPITYVWRRDGVTVGDGASITGGATASLVFSAFGPAQSGYYTVTASNEAGSVTSAPVFVGLATTQSVVFSPSVGALGVDPDAPLVVRFTAPPRVGSAGRISVRRVADDSLVETIDLAALPVIVNGAATYRYKSRNVGGAGGATYNYTPVVVVGDEARISLRSAAALAYSQSYYVTVGAGALLDSTGASIAPVAGPGAWTFSTKAAAPDPVPARTTFRVAADGSGDFSTLQAAIDHIPTGNTTPVRIELKAGVYAELINTGNRHNLTFVGEGHDNTVVQYTNNDRFNPGTALRASFYAKGNDLVFRDLTLRNTTPRGGAQAEALRSDGQRVVFAGCAFRSFQDTLLLGGTSHFLDCLVEGDTDYIWGGGTALFKNCELRCLNPADLTQARTPANRFGFVFVDCAVTKPAGASFSYGLGRNSDNGNVAFIDTRMDTHVSAAAWSGAFGSVNLRNWEYNSRNLAGTAAIDVGQRVLGRQLTAGEAAILRDPANVYGTTTDGTPVGAVGDGWVPAVEPRPAPVIVVDPVGRDVAAGQSVTFTVTATGSAFFTYQWRKGGEPLPGRVGASLTLSPVDFDDAGSYDVLVTSSGGTVSSAAAALAILTPIGAWAGGFGLDGTAPGFATADADGDGVANLLEYVLGGDPTAPDSGVLPLATLVEAVDGKHLVIEYRRAVVAADVPTRIETSTDLAGWAARTFGVDAEIEIIPLVGDGVNVDVNNSAANHHTGLAVAPGDGIVWNSFVPPGAASGTLTDVKNAADETTAIDVTIVSSGSGFSAWSNTTNGAPNPVLLMQDYLFNNAYTVTVGGLPEGAYLLYVYSHGDQDNQTATITLAAANGGGVKSTALSSGGAFRDAFATGAEGVAYVKFAPTVGASGTLQFTAANYLNGFQLVRLTDPAHERVRVTIPFTGDRLFARLRAGAE